MIAISTLLSDTPLNHEQKDYTKAIYNSGNTLLSIINDILDFAKIESGRMKIHNEVFELIECVEHMLSLIAPKAVEKN